MAGVDESIVVLGNLDEDGKIYGKDAMKVNQRIDINQEGEIELATNIVDIDDQPWTIGKNVLGGRNGSENEKIANINGGGKLVYPTKEQIFNKRYTLNDNKLTEIENLIDTGTENVGWNVGNQDILKLRNSPGTQQ